MFGLWAGITNGFLYGLIGVIIGAFKLGIGRVGPCESFLLI